MTDAAVQFRYADFLAGNWLLFRKRYLLKGLVRLVLTWGLIGAFLLTMTLEKTTSYQTTFETFILSFGCIGGGAAFGWLICICWNLPRAARRSFDAVRGEELVTRYAFDERQFFADNTMGHATLDWGLIAYWTENQHLLTILAANGILYVLPKDQVAQDFIAGLRSALITAGISTR